MVNPAFIAIGAFYAGARIYSAWQDMDWQSKYQAENKKFWDNYEKITGVKVKYAYRSGKIPNPSYYWRDIATMVGAGAGTVGFINGYSRLKHYPKRRRYYGY